LKGDLIVGLGGDSVEVSVGDSVRGFAIGDADVTIWGGLDGVVGSGLEECQGSCRGYRVSTVYHCRFALVGSIFFLPSSAVLGLCLLLAEASLRSTAPMWPSEKCGGLVPDCQYKIYNSEIHTMSLKIDTTTNLRMITQTGET
jgi:hypothetical protein